MKKVLSSILILFFIFFQVSTINAEEQTDSLSTDNSDFKTHSFQFQIIDFFKLSNFQGTLISYKYHFSTNSAFRFGIGMIIDDGTNNINDSYLGSDSSFTQRDVSNGDYRFIFQSQYIYYFSPFNDIKFFTGVGPYISYRTRNSREKLETTNSPEYRYKEKNISDIDEYNLGISAAYGMEWFFRNNMSLIVEYGFIFYYYNYERRDERKSIPPQGNESLMLRDSKNKGWKFNSSSVKFGLSIYL